MKASMDSKLLGWLTELDAYFDSVKGVRYNSTSHSSAEASKQIDFIIVPLGMINFAIN